MGSRAGKKSRSSYFWVDRRIFFFSGTRKESAVWTWKVCSKRTPDEGAKKKDGVGIGGGGYGEWRKNRNRRAEMKYVIEHMEQGFTPWVVLEYAQIIKDVGKENLYLVSLPEGTTEADMPKELIDLGLQWTTEDIVPYLAGMEDVQDKSDLCLLDPRAEIDLQPSDTANFKYFIFGGILGDHPPRDRTGELKKKLLCATRRLGSLQMTTDTAVRTTQIILEKQTKFENIKFIDYPEIRFNKHEATEMPFRYVLDSNGTPIFPKGMVELIHADNMKSLDDFF